MTMDYQENSEFTRLKHADVEQGKRIAELMADNERLRDDNAGLAYSLAGLHRLPIPPRIAELRADIAATAPILRAAIELATTWASLGDPDARNHDDIFPQLDSLTYEVGKMQSNARKEKP